MLLSHKKKTAIDKNNKNILNEIKSKYIIKQMFEFLNQKTFLRMIKYNNQLQTKLDMRIKEYFQIEIEIIPVDKPDAFNIFINYFFDKSYYHIYFNDNKEEISRNYYYKKDEVKKIKILLDYEIKSLSSLFKCCKCIKSINIIKYNREDITDMSGMFSKCVALEEIDLSNLKINDSIDVNYMFSECSEELQIKIQNQYKNIKKEAFKEISSDED